MVGRKTLDLAIEVRILEREFLFAKKGAVMFHVITERDYSEFSRKQIGEYTNFEKALDAAQKAIAGKEGLRYIIEKTDGHVDSYGNQIVTVVAESE